MVELHLMQWWPEFFKEHMNNELFELPEDYFIRNAHTEWNINTEARYIQKHLLQLNWNLPRSFSKNVQN